MFDVVSRILRNFCRYSIWGLLTGRSFSCLTFRFQNLYCRPNSFNSVLHGYLVWLDGTHEFSEESIILVISLSILLYFLSKVWDHPSSWACIASSVAVCNGCLVLKRYLIFLRYFFNFFRAV